MHMIAGELVTAQFIAAIQAQVGIAGEQRGVGQRRRRVKRARARMAAGGDDRMQFDDALPAIAAVDAAAHQRSEEHTSELQSLMRSSYAVFCLTKKKQPTIKYQLK